MRKEIQFRFHNIVSKAELLYGSEFWTLLQRDKSRINSSQMRFLRSLSGVTLRDKIKSENNYEAMESRRDYRRYSKLSTEMEPTCS